MKDVVRGSSSRPRQGSGPRGIAGASTSRTRDTIGSGSRDQAGEAVDSGEVRGRTKVRGRDVTISPLGDAEEGAERVRSKSKAAVIDFSAGGVKEGWREFRKGVSHERTYSLRLVDHQRSGTYTYPISFAIPSDSPPSLSCDFGSISYRLKATVHRAGTFASKLTATSPVTLVSCLGPDAMDEGETIGVERQWDDQLRYLVNVEGKAFPIGGILPISLTMMPMSKVAIYKIVMMLDGELLFFIFLYSGSLMSL